MFERVDQGTHSTTWTLRPAAAKDVRCREASGGLHNDEMQTDRKRKRLDNLTASPADSS